MYLPVLFFTAVGVSTFAFQGLQLIDDLRDRVTTMSAREVERLTRLTTLPGARFDGTHPPTAWRIEFATQRAARARVTLDSDTFATIVRELESVEAATPLAYRQAKHRRL